MTSLLTGTWFYLRVDQCCCRESCMRPEYIGGLCALHFAGAEAHERAVAYLLHHLRKELS